MKFPCIYCSKMVNLEDMSLDEIECESCNGVISLPLDNSEEAESNMQETNSEKMDQPVHPFRLIGSFCLALGIARLIFVKYEYPLVLINVGFVVGGIALIIAGKMFDNHKDR